jgi:hypothetical protein
VPTHPLLSVTDTGYVVVVVAEDVGVGDDVLFKVAPLPQAYVVYGGKPPLTFTLNCSVSPTHITNGPPLATTGNGFTVTVIVSVSEHVPELPVTVYVIDVPLVGVEITFVPPVVFK